MGTDHVARNAQDRELLKGCLNHEPSAWNHFVDRFLGLIYHVIQHTAHLRSSPLRPEDTEDVAAEVLLALVANDYAALRHFRNQSSLATYLTVIARRTCIGELVRRVESREVQTPSEGTLPEAAAPARAQAGLETFEEVARLLGKLPSRERQVVRLFFLEGRSYEEISTALHIPINSIGAILSRARKRLRQDVKSPPKEVRAPRPNKPEQE